MAWETDGVTLIGVDTASGAVVCRFVSDTRQDFATQNTAGMLATGGDGGTLHFLRPNAALLQLIGMMGG